MQVGIRRHVICATNNVFHMLTLYGNSCISLEPHTLIQTCSLASQEKGVSVSV